MDETRRGTVEMTVAMAVSGTIGWFVMQSHQPVLDVVFWRCAFGAATLLVVCLGMGLFRHLTWRIAGLAALGGVAIVANWLLLFAAYPRASIAIATAVYNTQPFMLLGLGAVFFGERITVQKLFWLVLAFGGTVLLVEATPGTGGDYAAGIAMALGAAFFYALAAIIAKHLKGTPPHLIALIHVVTGLVMAAPLVHWQALPHDTGTWTLLASIGVIHTGLVYILLYGAIQKLPTHLTGALSFIYPVTAIVVDYTAFGHRLDAGQLAGAALILLAAAGMTLGWGARRSKTVAVGDKA
ncbi:MAG: DMT family transporter [Asticcacaulis sp.]|nr:DMT family transporter [Asticcacaulis sp.]